MVYDVIVLGTGPAGLSAAVYCKRYDLNLIVIGKEAGAISEADEVDNYLGFVHISGMEMINKFVEHAEELGVEIHREEIIKIVKQGDNFIVDTDHGSYESRSLIYALGGTKRKLGLPEEKNFVGRGVSYCATCDGAFFRNKTAAVTGGSDSAAMAALLLSRFAKQVFIVYRRNKLRAFPVLVKKIENTENIKTIFNSVINEIKGKKLVEKIIIENTKTGEKSELELNGIFVEFGHVPNSDFAKNVGVETVENGRIKVKEDMSTNVRGFFAAGDVTTGGNDFDQAVTAAAEGSVAAASVYKLISEVG